MEFLFWVVALVCSKCDGWLMVIVVDGDGDWVSSRVWSVVCVCWCASRVGLMGDDTWGWSQRLSNHIISLSSYS